MDLLGGVGFIEDIDAHALPNSRAQHRPRELTIVGIGYYWVTFSGVAFGQLDLTPADAQHMKIRFHGHRKGAQTGTGGREARQLKEGPASEQAG
jgi:hypothetical protein